MKILIFGGSGFIGSNTVDYLLDNNPGWEVHDFDVLTYAARLYDRERYTRHQFDMRDAHAVRHTISYINPDLVLLFAAESHVDNSISSPEVFIDTNVKGTFNVLEACKNHGTKRNYLLSTDEVMEHSTGDRKTELNAIYKPSSVYSASKACQEMLVQAYKTTWGQVWGIVRSTNVYGPRQFPEKLVPLVISRAGCNESIPVYGNGLQVRDYLYVEDFARGFETIIKSGEPSGTYHISAQDERTNLETIREILTQMGKPDTLIKHVEDRKGHDEGYYLDSTKLRNLGWQPKTDFKSGIAKTIEWFKNDKGSNNIESSNR